MRLKRSVVIAQEILGESAFQSDLLAGTLAQVKEALA